MAFHYPNKLALGQAFPIKDVAGMWQNYKENIRPNIRNADLIFCSGNAWNSKLIQWQSHNVWSHVGIIVRLDEIDRVFLLESVDGTGVRLVPLSKVLYDYEGDDRPYNGRVFVARHQAVNPSNASTIIKRGMDRLTYQYDDWEYWEILLRIIFGRGKLKNNRQYYCSELVHECFLQANIHLKYETGLFMAPGTFWDSADVEILYPMI